MLFLFTALLAVAWSQVSATELHHELLDHFPGTYEASVSILFSNPEKEHNYLTLYYTFEPPIWQNTNKTEAMGRAIQSQGKVESTTMTASGADGHTADYHGHSLLSYAMTLDNLHQEFVIRLTDQDDTSVWSLRYNADGIVGDGFEVPEVETRTQGASLGVGNSFVATMTMKKASSHPFDKIPTYHDQWVKLNNLPVGTDEPGTGEESPMSSVDIIIIVIAGCGVMFMAVCYIGWRRKRTIGYVSCGQNPLASDETQSIGYVPSGGPSPLDKTEAPSIVF